MKVRLLDAIAGEHPKTGEPVSLSAGVHDIDAKWAKALLEGGTAEPVAEKRRGVEKRPAGKPAAESRGGGLFRRRLGG
jgi:hypothetical protein